ncbi:MAG: hypothetical protein ACOYXT_24580 [Bacteroidota bacterium]
MNNRLVLILLLICTLTGYAQKNNVEARYVDDFAANVFRLTEVMFHDVINPPAAARFYAYSMLAAEKIVAENSSQRYALNTVIRDYPSVLQPPNARVNVYFSAIYAMLETGKGIIPSGHSLQEKQDLLYRDFLKSGIKKQVLDSSVNYAKRVAQIFIKHSKSDGYLKLSTLKRYEPRATDSTWYPTPPEYMAAVEPNWSTVRSFFLDSCEQFTPMPPVRFNSQKGSPFYLLMHEVYVTGKNLTAEQNLIARYWDCNPFANFYAGHVSVAIKKISPGGHWMSITV